MKTAALIVLDPSKITPDAASAKKDRRTLLRGVAELPLPYIPRTQRPPQIAQQTALVGGPGGGQQFTRGGVALEAMDDDAGGDARQGGAEEVDVFIAPEGAILACGVLPGQRRALGNIDVVELEAADGQGKRPVEALQKVAFFLAGQSGHEVGAYGDAARGCHTHGFFRAGCCMPPVNAGQGGVVGRLQAQLQPEVAIKAREQVELFVIQTVGAGSHAHAEAAGQTANSLEQLLQAF